MIFLFIILSTIRLSAPAEEAHDAVIAVFNLKEHEGRIELDVSFDIQDFLALNHKSSGLNDREGIENYINATTSWEIDGEKAELKMIRLKRENDHFRVSFLLKNIRPGITTLKINNDFFLHIEDHSNIIMLDLNDGFRDFRMHKARSKIEVVYD